MSSSRAESPVRLFSTCPPSSDFPQRDYLRRVIDVAQWSERAGCTGTLVYSDNRLVDPWAVSQLILQNTQTLCPLVAVQPIYMHPYTVAKMVASFAYLYERRVFLNMVAGGFKNDLEALNDSTPHDERYERLAEYTTLVMSLLLTAGPVTYESKAYKVKQLRMTPPLRADLAPGVFVSGSSDAGIDAAKALGATAVKYPKPSGEEIALPDGDWGIRIGIIARENSAEAWRIARTRFPEDRQGQLTHQLAMRVSDSRWHRQLSDLPAEIADSPYWLVPFQHYKTMCPYLVGSVAEISEEIGRYLALGYRSFILDIPQTSEDLEYTNSVFQNAMQAVS